MSEKKKMRLPGLHEFEDFRIDIGAAAAELLGATEHKRAFVSDEVVLSTLRGHNSCLSAGILEGARRDAELKAARCQSSRLAMSLEELRQFATEQAVVLRATLDRLEATEEDLQHIKTQLGSVDELKASVKDLTATSEKHGDRLDDAETAALEANKKTEVLEAGIASLGLALTVNEEAVLAVNDKIRKLPAELKLPAENIMLPRDLQQKRGEEEEEVKDAKLREESKLLPNLLTLFKEQLKEQEDARLAITDSLDEHDKRLQGKAILATEGVVKKHGLLLEGIRKKLESNEEVDMPALAVAQQEATDALKRILEEMQFKVGYDDVDYKIEARYAEILTYLEQSLRTREHDDDDIRRDTTEIRGMIAEIKAAKADRGDLNRLRAHLVSTMEAASQRNTLSDIEENFRADLALRPLRDELDRRLQDRPTFDELVRAINQQPSFHKSSSPLSPAPQHRPGTAPLCMSCETPLINAGAKLTKRGGQVRLGALRQTPEVLAMQARLKGCVVGVLPAPESAERHLGHVGVQSVSLLADGTSTIQEYQLDDHGEPGQRIEEIIVVPGSPPHVEKSIAHQSTELFLEQAHIASRSGQGGQLGETEPPSPLILSAVA